MKTWIISLSILAISASVIFWAFSPLFITYAQVLPHDIQFDISNSESVINAIIKTEQRTIEYLREIHGDSIIAVSTMVLINAIIAIYYAFKASKPTKTNN